MEWWVQMKKIESNTIQFKMQTGDCYLKSGRTRNTTLIMSLHCRTCNLPFQARFSSFYFPPALLLLFGQIWRMACKWSNRFKLDRKIIIIAAGSIGQLLTEIAFHKRLHDFWQKLKTLMHFLYIQPKHGSWPLTDILIIHWFVWALGGRPDWAAKNFSSLRGKWVELPLAHELEAPN